MLVSRRNCMSTQVYHTHLTPLHLAIPSPKWRRRIDIGLFESSTAILKSRARLSNPDLETLSPVYTRNMNQPRRSRKMYCQYFYQYLCNVCIQHIFFLLGVTFDSLLYFHSIQFRSTQTQEAYKISLF